MKKTALIFCLFPLILSAGFRIDPVFSSNMVLQQKRPICFRGTADNGTKLDVSFAGKKIEVQPDPQGKWVAEFPAMNAGTDSYVLRISDGEKEIVFSNILIGEVWLASGQSNMKMPIGAKFRFGWSAANCENEVAAADYPLIRFADQINVSSHLKPCKARLAKGEWTACSPGTAAAYSATAYFFARELHRKLKIPVGIICTAWSGSRIEPWISKEGYLTKGLENQLEIIQKYTIPDSQKKDLEKKEYDRYHRENTRFLSDFRKKGASAKERCAVFAYPDFDDSEWKAARSDKTMDSLVRWYRTRFQVNNVDSVSLKFRGQLPAVSDIYLNGKRIGGSSEEKKFYFPKTIKSSDLNSDSENVLAVRIEIRGYPFERAQRNSIISHTILSDGDHQKTLRGWKECDEFRIPAKERRIQPPKMPDLPYKSHQFYCNIYNGMVNGWIDVPIRGVIWYQGESNAGQHEYLDLFKTLIADWRAKWNQPEMPFIAVQLAGYGASQNWKKQQPRDFPFAITRDIQMKLLDDRNFGLACTIDIGENFTIHPPNKQDVGRRLALEAERIAYGRRIVSRGPIFDFCKVEGNNIRVFFKNADSGLKTSDGKKPGAFAIAGANGKFVWADAEISGKTVLVSSPKIKSPKYVRYAFVSYRPDCNLQNAEGLPAYPFRSDDKTFSSSLQK